MKRSRAIGASIQGFGSNKDFELYKAMTRGGGIGAIPEGAILNLEMPYEEFERRWLVALGIASGVTPRKSATPLALPGMHAVPWAVLRNPVEV